MAVSWNLEARSAPRCAAAMTFKNSTTGYCFAFSNG
jgi:hypothetical protein